MIKSAWVEFPMERVSYYNIKALISCLKQKAVRLIEVTTRRFWSVNELLGFF